MEPKNLKELGDKLDRETRIIYNRYWFLEKIKKRREAEKDFQKLKDEISKYDDLSPLELLCVNSNILEEYITEPMDEDPNNM